MEWANCGMGGKVQVRQRDEVQSLGPAAVTAPTFRPGLVKHIVLLRYRPTVSHERQAMIMQRFVALKSCTRGQRRYIVAIERAEQRGLEGTPSNFQQGFIVTFASEGDRNYFVGAPLITDPRYYDPQPAVFNEWVSSYLALQNGRGTFDISVPEVEMPDGVID